MNTSQEKLITGAVTPCVQNAVCCAVPIIAIPAAAAILAVGTISSVVIATLGVGTVFASLFLFIKFGGVSFLKNGNWIINIKNNLSSNLLKTLFKTFIVASFIILGSSITTFSILLFLSTLFQSGAGGIGSILIGSLGLACCPLTACCCCISLAAFSGAGDLSHFDKQNKKIDWQV